MSDTMEALPINTRLLSDAIMELSIARRNVSVYPRNHPIVEQSLARAYTFLNKLFELRNEITLGIAKDTLIIDSYFLDKKNPVYKEFALCLSKLNLANVTFIIGLTKDELYSFQRFTLSGPQVSSSENVENLFNKFNLPHIKIECIDYNAFCMVGEQACGTKNNAPLWEQYIAGLFEGRLQSTEVSDVIQEVAPDKVAGFINSLNIGDLKEESYDKVISSYVRRSSEDSFTGKNSENSWIL